MKNTFLGLLVLSFVWLSSCGGAASPIKKPGTTVSSTSTTATANSTTPSQPENNITTPTGNEGAVVQLTKAIFLEKIYDFEKNPRNWTYKGDKPCVIDFYADWCRPCKMVSPILAELSEKYKGQIIIYKLNTDQEREIAQFFGIRSIPTLFFCPAKGDPQMTQGALPKETYEKIISEVLLKK